MGSKGWVIQVGLADPKIIERKSDQGVVMSRSNIDIEEVQIIGLGGACIKFWLYTLALLTKPGFGSYLFPYLIFYCAVILAINYEYDVGQMWSTIVNSQGTLK